MKAYLVTLRDCDASVIAAERPFDAVTHALTVANADLEDGAVPMEFEDLEGLQEIADFEGVAGQPTLAELRDRLLSPCDGPGSGRHLWSAGASILACGQCERRVGLLGEW